MDLVLRSVARLPKYLDYDKDRMSKYYVEKAIPDEFWFEYDFINTWVKSGLGFPMASAIGYEATKAWMRLRGLCLENTIQTKSMYHAEHYADDVEFMSRAIVHHPILYFDAKGDAKNNMGLMIMGFASCADQTRKAVLKYHFAGEDAVVDSCLKAIQEQLELSENFNSLILGNMLSTQCTEDTGTPLTMLNQGEETSLVYKKRLAEYLGLPTGKWLLTLQQARQNILDAIAPWSSLNAEP